MNRLATIIIAAILALAVLWVLVTGWDSQIDSPDTAPAGALEPEGTPPAPGPPPN